MSNLKWKLRVKKHYRISKTLLVIAKWVFYRYVADKSIVQFMENTNEYAMDRYTCCKNWEKSYCPMGNKAKYTLYIGGGHGYGFMGNDELECYMTALWKFYGKSPLTFPRDRKMTQIKD